MLVKFNPLNSAVARDSFFGDFFPTVEKAFEPKVDIRENDKEFVVSAELPGLNKEDFKLTVENNVLILEGEKKVEHEETEEGYYQNERFSGAFKRSFRLTDSVNSKKIDADFKNGVLTITIPKAEKAKPKEIEIKIN